MKALKKLSPKTIWLSIVLIAALVVVVGCTTPLGSALSATAQTSSPTPVVAPATTTLPTEVAIDQESLADLYDKVLPSVVNIKVTLAPDSTSAPTFEFPFNFPGFPNTPPQGQQAPVRGEGSGWVFDDQGHIVTNNHVVDGAQDIVVTFHNGLWAKAEVVATDPQSDLAVIKVDPPEGVDLHPLPLAPADSLRVGYTVIAIGAPFGLESTMTTGIVSALGRSFPVGEATGGRYTLPAVIQTDAAINPGNSGGPLLNLKGEVVGINFAIESPVRGSSGIGFAIPVSIVQRVVPALIKEGTYHYAYLGISGQSVTPEIADALDLPQNVLGAYVGEVVKDGPADKAGVRGGTKAVDVDGVTLYAGGDIIVAIDGQPVRQFNDLVAYLVTKAEPGQDVTLTVYRDGKQIDLKVTLGERPTAPAQPERGQAGLITPKAAIAIARDHVTTEKLLKGDITETIVTQDSYKGRPAWVVQLSDGKQTATVVVDAHTGDVLDTSVK